MRVRKSCIQIFFLLFVVTFATGQNKVVIIKHDHEKWKMIVNGDPFLIKGVVGNEFISKVKEYGGNSVRAGCHKEELDKINDLGLNALVNLPAEAERDGMNYNDTVEVNRQTDNIVAIVRKLKDHPAVLMWAIGNELDYIPPLEPFNPKVWDAVNRAAKAIHKIDPDHPVMTVIGTSMMKKVADIKKRCPEIDLLGINSYGDIYTLTDTLKKYGWTKPYVITEWGPDGYWEVPKTAWGVPYEQTGLEKYNCYKKKYLSISDPENTQCLGSFVFYWSGFKQEHTHTWFCMFDSTGLESPLVGLMRDMWTGQKLKNQDPIVDSINIEGFTSKQPVVLFAGSTVRSVATVSYPDKNKLRFRWEIRPEAEYASYAGQGEKVPEPLKDLFLSQARDARFNAPSLPGPYRLFVYTYDNNGHFSTANLPFFVSQGLTDTTKLGKYTSRTLHLLNGSTSGKKNTVKILVYGQSIAEQKWWLEVKRFVETRYPNSCVQMLNKSIGGFASQLLYKTTEMDVSPFYPDLVLIHDYGDNRYYDSVLYTIRSRTAAEVAIINDHFTGENKWSDTMSYYILPALAEKYKCDMINIRDPWKKYLSDHDLKPAKLLTDGAHLNDFGNFFMAELIKPLFRFRSEYPANELGLERTYYKGKDFRFTGDTLVLPFYGNKAEVIIDKSGSSCTDSLKVLIDGVPPSSFRGCYFITRPYNDTGKKWPWELPAMIRIRNTKPWIDEEWSCKFTEAEPPFNNFSFTITGSVTGEDGKGSGGSDFISASGRVIIKGGDAENGGDWHLNRSLKVVKSVVKPGDEVKWKTYSICTDYIRRSKKEISAVNDPLILFQGIPNGSHKLMLIKKGRCNIDISEISIFKPFYND